MEKTLVRCACGCGDEWDPEEYQWWEIDGQTFATLECWESYANAAVSLIWNVVLFVEDGKQITVADWRKEYDVVIHG